MMILFVSPTIFEYIGNSLVVLLLAGFASSVLTNRMPVLTYAVGVLVLGIGGAIIDSNMADGVAKVVFAQGMYLAYVLLCFKGKLAEKILAYCFAFVSINIGQFMTLYAVSTLEMNALNIFIWLVLVPAILAAAQLFLIARVWKHLSFVMNSVRSMSFFLLPVTQFLCMFTFVYFFSKRKGTGGVESMEAQSEIAAVLIFVCALFYVADGIFLDAMVKMARDIREKERTQALELESELQYEYIKSMERDIAEMSKYRHDYSNMISTVRAAIAAEDEASRENALELVEQMDGELMNIRSRKYCECGIVNCILSYEEDKMIAGGIECDLRAEVPAELGVSELDLCRVLTNMLDNARQSCEKLENPADRCVACNLRVCDGYLYITVRNSCPPGDLKLTTDKEDKRRHGLGVHIMEEITCRCGGELIISREDEAVRVTATLEWKEREEKQTRSAADETGGM